MTDTPPENQQTQPEIQASAPSVDGGTIVAKPGQYYRNTRYLMTVLLVGMGLWFGYDGFVGWPKSNQMREKLIQDAKALDARGDRRGAEKLVAEAGKYKQHTDTDI